MSEEKKRKAEGISRREFIKDAGFVVGGAAAVMATTGLLGCEEEAAKEPWLPEKWDHEADVVVVGYGGGWSSGSDRSS